MIITESELRRIIRQEILNESLSINISEEELLEEGIKSKLQNVLLALGLTASLASSVVSNAHAQDPAEVVSSVVDDIFSKIPNTCPASDDKSWWRSGEAMPGIEDYLADVYEGNDSVENYVKFFIVSAMKDQRLHTGITRIYENSEEIPQDMLNKDTDYNPEAGKNYRFSSPEQKAWLYIKRFLIQAGKESIQSNSKAIFDKAIQDLKDRAEDFFINDNKFTSRGRTDYKM